MVQTLAAADELQRELTYDGLRAAEAKGAKSGRRPAVAVAQTADVRTAYLRGRSIAALARCRPLDGGQGLPAVPAQRKAPREYENRVSTRTPRP
ncbi:hypothetical protein [Streptomyces sp. JV190]|nr:hypothetical protein [Streptomyces sp. JV190]MEE1842813.1 hypothetical protein [Streptomyces sp. JV190]